MYGQTKLGAVRASEQLWHQIRVSDVQVPQTRILRPHNHVQVATFGIEITYQGFFYRRVHFFQFPGHTSLLKFKIRAVLASNLSFRCSSASETHFMAPQPCAICNVWD